MGIFKRKKLIYALVSILAVIGVSICVALVMNAAIPHSTQEKVISVDCPVGFVVVPGNNKYNTKDFCVMKYEAKFVNGVPKSQAVETPWVDIPQIYAVDVSKRACRGCHLITENEWLTIAQNILNVPSNWSLGKVGGGYVYSGHNDGTPASSLAASKNDDDGYSGIKNSDTDTKKVNDDARNSQRRTLKLSNGQTIWDFSGNVAEWTAGQTTGGQPGIKNESAFSWKDWNTVNVNGFLTTNPMPGYGNELASVWNSKQGLGQLYSNVNDDKIRGFIRGGSYLQGDKAGIFSLDLGNDQTFSSASVGFRVAK